MSVRSPPTMSLDYSSIFYIVSRIEWVPALFYHHIIIRLAIKQALPFKEKSERM